MWTHPSSALRCLSCSCSDPSTYSGTIANLHSSKYPTTPSKHPNIPPYTPINTNMSPNTLIYPIYTMYAKHQHVSKYPPNTHKHQHFSRIHRRLQICLRLRESGGAATDVLHTALQRRGRDYCRRREGNQLLRHRVWSW